jgi:hypothetical protein
MLDQDVFSKITRISKEKTHFMLSEILPDLTGEKTSKDTESIIETINKELPRHGLSIKKIGKDYEISSGSKIPEKDKFILTPDDQKRLNRFFEEPKVPRPLDELIQGYIEKKTGKRWDDPVILERIRQAVIAQKGDYWREGKKKIVQYEQGYRIFAYLAYQFPVYFIQFEHILGMLASSDLLKEDMTVLDIGSGPGVAALATIDFLSRAGHGNATLYAVEIAGEQREAFSYLTTRFSDGITGITVNDPLPENLTTVPTNALPRDVDLLVFQNVLNELTGLTIRERAARVKTLSEVLSPEGVIVITEPADMVNSIAMRQTVQELTFSGFVVTGPCPQGWTKTCNSQQCWSFIEKPPLRPTRLMEMVASCKESYRFLNTDIKYSYAVLKKNTSLKGPDYHTGIRKKTAALSTLSRHVDRRINIGAAVMSGDLGNSKTHLWKVCDGTPQKPVYAVMPSYHLSSENEFIMKAAYGEQVDISGVLVRYNPQHDSYNLLITRATRIVPTGKKTARS